MTAASAFVCPRCNRKLLPIPKLGRTVYLCPECRGEMLLASAYRAITARDLREKVIARLETMLGTPTKLPCPSCRRPMPAHRIPGRGSEITVEVCRPCWLLWFDAGELESLPKSTDPDPGREEDDEGVAELDETTFEEIVKNTVLPVDIDISKVKGSSRATFLLIAVCAVFYALQVRALPESSSIFVFDPAVPFANFGLNALTSIFSHASVHHLLGNLFFLYVFGCVVESIEGVERTIELFLFAGIAGVLVHLGISASPVLGASGAISGLMAYAAIRQPYLKVSIVPWQLPVPGIWNLFSRIRMPLYLWFLVYVLFQDLQGGLIQFLRGGGDGIAYGAHLGGTLAGVLFYKSEK